MNPPDPLPQRIVSMRASTIAADWPAPAHVVALTTLRGPGGASKPPFDRLNLGARAGDDPETVSRNRDELIAGLELPSAPHWLQQVHGRGVVVFDRPAKIAASGCGYGAEEFSERLRAEPVADAAVTSVAGVVLAILTADCMPVLFCTQDGSAIAAAHAGWRGLAGGVLERTIETMGAPPSRLLAWLGPAIGAASYEVGEEVRAAFVDRDPGATAAFVATRPGHWLCDLYLLARRRLEASGVPHIHGGGYDTFADPRWYSFRRDGARSGRFASLVWIDPRG